MFSLNIILETIPHPDYSPITEYVPSSQRFKTKDDHISMSFLKENYPFLQMQKTITYTDAESLKQQLNMQLAHFSMDKEVIFGCTRAYHQKVISIFRNANHPLPDFAVHCIATLFMNNPLQFTLKECDMEKKRDPYFHGIENAKIQEMINKYLFLKKKSQSNSKSHQNGWFSITLGIILVIQALLLEFAFTNLFLFSFGLTLISFAVIPPLFGKVLNYAFSFYNTPEKLKAISKTSEKEALIAGFQPESLKSFIKHLKHPMAFLAGMKFRRFEEMPQSEIILALYQFLAEKEAPNQQAIRDKCIAAALSRKNAALTPMLQTSTTNKEISLPSQPEGNAILVENEPRLRME